MKKKLVIIGYGAAVKSFLKYFRRNDYSIEVYSMEQYPYSRMAILDVIRGDVSFENIKFKIPEKIKFYPYKQAVRVDAQKHLVEFNDETVAEYDRLIIGTGSVPKRPDFLYKDIPVLTVKHIEDAVKLQSLIRAGKKHIVLYGGGFINMEVAWTVKKLGGIPIFVITSLRIMSRVFVPEASGIIEKILRSWDIQIFRGEKIKEARGNIVILSSGREIIADAIVVGKGVSPALPRISGIEVKENNGYFKIDEDIYLIGDGAKSYNPLTGEFRYNAIWNSAIKQGKYLAKLFNGEITDAYQGDIAFNMLNVFGQTIFTWGESSQGKVKWVVKREDQFLYKCTDERGRITGIGALNIPVEQAYIKNLEKMFLKNF